MSRGINKVIIVGNLGEDPEVKVFSSGSSVCNFSVATSESWKDKSTGEEKEKTEWHRVSAFGKLSEICGRFLRKGSKVYIEGSLETKKWQGSDGSDRHTTSIKAREMQMLGGKGEQSSAPAPTPAPASSGHQPGSGFAGESVDEDIPF